MRDNLHMNTKARNAIKKAAKLSLAALAGMNRTIRLFRRKPSR